MKRKTIYLDNDTFMGQFEPETGWQSGRPGIRRVLCKVSEVDGLSEDKKLECLLILYKKTKRNLKNQSNNKKIQKEKEKQKARVITTKEAVKIWLESDPTWSLKTKTDYKSSLTKYIAATDNHVLREFIPQYYANFLKFLQGNYSNTTTQNKHVRHFKIFIAWAYQNDFIKKQYVLKAPAIKKKDMDTYTLSELHSLKDNLMHDLAQSEKGGTASEVQKYKNLLRAYMLATQTLLRVGAIWSLTLANINISRRMIHIRDNKELDWINKQHKQPIKPINETLNTFLINDLSTRNPREKYYLDKGNGQPWRLDCGDLSRQMSKYTQSIGLPKIKPFHWGMRATMITALLSDNVAPHIVQKLADHSSLATTMSYFNTRTIDQKEAVNSLDMILR